MQKKNELTNIIGNIPYRMAFAGGWIDQPFVSQCNPEPPGSMVVVGLEPTFRFMDRCGMSTSTRKIAIQLWPEGIPDGDPEERVKELYEAENQGKSEPSGSQDMIGLIYPGVSRIDYDYTHQGGFFPIHVEANTDQDVARWIEQVVSVVPVCPRPEGYNPLLEKNLAPEWIQHLGQSGKDCFDAIINKNITALGASMNDCMACWEAILPCTVRHETLTVDLKKMLTHYQSEYMGAMYSGCGGGYLYVVSEEPVPGGLRVNVRTQ